MSINGIAFCGDSFCAAAGPGTPEGVQYDDTHQYDWPFLVSQHLNAKITCTGIYGTNFYHSVQSLFGQGSHYLVEKPLDETDLVIFVVSEPHRMINIDRLPMTFGWLQDIAEWPGNEDWSKGHQLALQAVTGPQKLRTSKFKETELTVQELATKCKVTQQYVDLVYDWTAAEVMQHSFIMFVDERMVAMNKKAIWFNAFKKSNAFIPGWCDKWRPKSGPVGNIPLYEISCSEVDKEIRWEDPRRNHLSPKLNKVLAAIVIDAIDRDPELNPGTLDMTGWFDLSGGITNNPDDPYLYP